LSKWIQIIFANGTTFVFVPIKG